VETLVNLVLYLSSGTFFLRERFTPESLVRKEEGLCRGPERFYTQTRRGEGEWDISVYVMGYAQGKWGKTVHGHEELTTNKGKGVVFQSREDQLKGKKDGSMLPPPD